VKLARGYHYRYRAVREAGGFVLWLLYAKEGENCGSGESQVAKLGLAKFSRGFIELRAVSWGRLVLMAVPIRAIFRQTLVLVV
jgi:hypothetical protein